MNDQDKRAVEGMARCGINLEGLCTSFPKFPREEIEKIPHIINGRIRRLGSWMNRMGFQKKYRSLRIQNAAVKHGKGQHIMLTGRIIRTGSFLWRKRLPQSLR